MRKINLDTPEQDAADFSRQLAYIASQISQNGGTWEPACGGTEVPFKSRSGLTLLYCWNRQTGAHAYINTTTDMPLSHAEAEAALGLY